MDYEYICLDCLERFNTEPPLHLEVKHCPCCGGHDICTVEIYERNQLINAQEALKE